MILYCVHVICSKCVEIMVRVLELRAKQWGNPPSALTSSEAAASSSSTTHLNQYLGLGLGGPGPPESDPGGEGAAFIMPSEFGDAYHQAPVSNPGYMYHVYMYTCIYSSYVHTCMCMLTVSKWVLSRYIV